MDPLISIIVPTYNSAVRVDRLLASIAASTRNDVEVIINDDPRSIDDIARAVKNWRDKGLSITLLKSNDGVPHARLLAAAQAKGSIFVHIDSDMLLTARLLDECVTLLNKGHGALILTEESIGVGFWARCRWLEKRLYQGVERIESLRCLPANVYWSVGGHDGHLIFNEDKDLDLRVRRAGIRVGRTRGFVLHDEGRLSMRSHLRKMAGYGRSAWSFHDKHPREFWVDVNPLARFGVFLRRPGMLASHPSHTLGLFTLKCLEYGAATLGSLKKGDPSR